MLDEQRDPLFRTRPCSILRLGPWKLHEYFEDGGIELYNLRDDIREQNNLASSMPAKRDELHAILRTWRKEVGAPIPSGFGPEAGSISTSLKAILQLFGGRTRCLRHGLMGRTPEAFAWVS